ncbi:MAG: hypothetical protein P8Y60_04485 [Calditrichota bacterium]|jgi:hypothetical protein
MKTPELMNRIKVQTNRLPKELNRPEIDETARGIALYYRNNEFVCQTFFTPPVLGEINWIEGLDPNAEVYFREINYIGPNLFHIRLIGGEDPIRKMFTDQHLYNLLWGIQGTLNESIRSRRYLDTTRGKERYDVIVSLDKKTYWFANWVKLNNQKTRIDNVLIAGNRLLGLTENHEVVWSQLTPDVVEKQDVLLEVNPLETVNKLGKIDLLETVPNTDDFFLATIKNTIYQFNIWGDMIYFNKLDDQVKHITSIDFNSKRSIMSTTDGIYEVDVQEMPNMVKVTSLPRQISNPHLKNNFKMAMYVEDPYILGINPAIGVFAKTEDEKVVFF